MTFESFQAVTPPNVDLTAFSTAPMPTATAVAAAAITAHLTALDAVSQVLQWICYKLETKYHLNFKRFILFSREASPFLLSLPFFLALCFKLDSN